jgi:hypothetical protein
VKALAAEVEAPDVEQPTPAATYKVVAFSIYVEDLEQLRSKVARLKTLGWGKASASHLVRIALRRLDDEALREIAKNGMRGR